MNQVIVIIGAGGIGVAIARRQGFGKTVLLGDFNEAVLSAAAEQLRTASYAVETQIVDVSSRESVVALAERAASLGSVMQVVNTAGLSPNMAPPERVLAVDLYGSALVFEVFGEVIAAGGAGLIISSMAGHMLPPLTPEENNALAFTPADDLLELPFVKAVPNSMVGYMVAKRANNLRVQAEAIRWGERGARIVCRGLRRQLSGRNHPIRSRWTIPRASRRSVLTAIADNAALTCRAYSSTGAKPAPCSPS